MKPYRSCSCRDPGTGKQLGRKCPHLAAKNHGRWFARFEAPPGADGKRRQLRVGPYATEREAKAALIEALGKISDGKHVDDRKTTLGEYLDRWLEWKRSALAPSTFASYREGVELYFRPGLGHVRLVDLRADDIKTLYAAMRKISWAEDGDRSELLRRLVAARARWHVPTAGSPAAQRVAERISTRPLTDARIRRMHAVLRAALNDAETLPVNPAAAVKLGKVRKVKPLLWTDARTKRWQETGEVPAKVMVWTPAQCGQFLDSIEELRLYSLFHVAAYYGLRRGELTGLAWSDVDLRTRRLHVRGDDDHDVKSEDSDREIIIDQGTAAVLKAWRSVQRGERLAWGPAWTDTGRAHEYDLAEATAELGISEGPRKGQTVTLRQVTRRVPARAGSTRQIHALTSRDDLTAGEVCWRLSSRWREKNYFRYARTRFALDALDSYATAPDDPDRMVPNPARKTAAARIRAAEQAITAAETARDAALLQLRSPAPGQSAYLTNQVINALAAPVEAAWRDLAEAGQAAAAVPARIPLGTHAPDMARLDAETKQITHTIRMAAYNAETTLARALDGHYARASDEAYALIREALTTSGDIRPGNGHLLIRLDPLTAPRRTQALAALCDQLTAAGARYPGTGLVLRYEVKSHPSLA